jgi:hypothetical protein
MRAQGTTVVEAKPSRLGLWIGLAAVVAVAGGLAVWKLGGSSAAEPAADAAAAAEQAPAAQVAERPSLTPSAGAVEPDLQVSVPDLGGEVHPPESSGDGLTESTAPRTPTVAAPKPPKKGASKPASPATQTSSTPAGGETPATTTQTSSTPAFVVPQGGVSEIYEARRAAQFNIRPENTLITINGVAIGRAEDWGGGTFSGGGRPYPFRDPGDYYVELKADGYQTTWIKIVIRPDAKDLTIRVRTKLPKQL